MGLGTSYIVKYIADTKNAVQGANDLEKLNAKIASTIGKDYATATRIVGSDLQKISKTPITINGQQAIQSLQQIGTVAQTADGSFVQFTETQKLINGQLVKTTGSIKDVTNQFVKGNLEAEKGNKVFTNLADNVKQLAGRALLTIPIWIALRAAIMGVIKGVQGGVKNLIEFDLSLQKIRNNLQGTPQEVEVAFKKIKNSITEASKATGISTEQLAGAVKQFATLGFSANESLQGALGATKLAVALFGDASDTAGAFARALNILIDRSEGARSAVDQMNEAFALTSQLEETNNFEIKNVTEALDKFAGTAAGVGLTMNQTLQILAALGTAGRQGSEGATLLSTSFNQLLSNLPKISQSLGLVVTTGESTFDTFRKILDKVTELNNTPGGQNASIQAIADIFGGARGIKIVQSLVAVKDILDKNIATLPSFTALNQKAGRTLNTQSGQARALGNDLKEMGKSFITAVLGTEDFTNALIKLRAVIQGTSSALNLTAETLSTFFGNLFSPNKMFAEAFSKGLDKLDKKASAQFAKLNDALKGQLAIPDLEILIGKIEANVKPGNLNMERVIEALKFQLQKQLSGDVVSVETDAKVNVTPIISFEEQQSIAKLLLQNKLDELKLQGATNTQLAQAKILATDQLNIKEDTLTLLNQQLDLEKAIQEEKRLQNKLGSDSIKLFNIAQQDGVEIARQIGDVLAGNKDFNIFARQGGKALEVFKREFEDLFKQQQALQFFTGERVTEAPNLRRGTSVAIQEEALRQERPIGRTELTRAQAAAQQGFTKISQIQATAPVTVNANIDISKLSEVKDQFVKEVTKQLPQAGTDINNALQQALLGKQGNGL
jgi:TP901 family phage tail tape measure protein